MNKFLDYLMKFFIFLTIFLALLAILQPDLVKSFIEWMRGVVNYLGNWNYLVVFLSGMIESFPVLGVVVPGQNILLIAGGFFAEQSTQKLIFVVIFASLGAIVGNYIGYLLGKKYGKSFFKKYGLWFGIGETEVEYLEKGIKKWGPWGIILGKFHNIARAFVPFIAGSMGMQSKKFMIYNIIGSVLRALTIVLLGVLFAKTYETVIDYFEYLFLGLLVIGGLYVFFFKKKEFMVYMEKKNKEIEEKVAFGKTPK